MFGFAIAACKNVEDDSLVSNNLYSILNMFNI